MPDRLDTIFAALSAPTRRAILSRLAAGEAQVGEIARQFRISPPAISRHLRVLEDAGLVTRRVEAQRRIIALDPEALRLASRWVDQYRSFWETSLDRLETLFANVTDDDHASSKKDKPHAQADKPSRRD